MGRVLGRPRSLDLADGPNEGVGLGVCPEEPLPVSVPDDTVSDGVAEGLEVPVGVPDPDGEEDPVGVGVVPVGVGAGDVDVVVGVGDADDVAVPVGVAVAVGLALVAVGLGVLDGVADGQPGAVAE